MSRVTITLEDDDNAGIIVKVVFEGGHEPSSPAHQQAYVIQRRMNEDMQVMSEPVVETGAVQ